VVWSRYCTRQRFFLLTCKADQGKKSSGFQRFIIKWKRDCFISAVKSRWENIKTSFYG
jgi:DNA segregation ATPase FtsK/SpoIIIE and related proteins